MEHYSSVLAWICLSTPKILWPNIECCNPAPEALFLLGCLCNIIFFEALLESNQWPVSCLPLKTLKNQMECDPIQKTCPPFCLSYWPQNTSCFPAGPMFDKDL